MRNRYSIVAVLVLVLGSLPCFAQFGKPQFKVGDPAPPLEVTEWIKGAPVDLEKGRGKKIYLVEFWATWCGPCLMTVPKLTELQKKFADDLVIIGATALDRQGNNLRSVKHFVETQGAKMDYTVAFDETGKSSERYLEAARAMGIPHAFLIGKEGKLLWQGSPLDPELESTIAAAVSGTLTVEIAVRRAKADEKLNQLSMQVRMGNTEGIREGLLEVLDLDPGNAVAIDAMHQYLREGDADGAQLTAWINGHIEKYQSDPQAMFQLARVLCSAGVPNRTPELALKAAKISSESSSATGMMIEVYALALYEIGAIDKAIEVQMRAVEKYSGADAELAGRVLKVYEQCAKLKAGIE